MDTSMDTSVSPIALHPPIGETHRDALRVLCDAFAEQLHRSLLAVVDSPCRASTERPNLLP
jgi:hypothetical protein